MRAQFFSSPSRSPMAAGRFSTFFLRVAAVPWRIVASDAFDRVLLVTKTLCFAHVFNNYVCGINLVLGSSMLPTIDITGELVAVERISRRWGLISAGDIVTLRSPEEPMKIVAKRVLALEGDDVTYLADPTCEDSSKTILVPRGHVWVQGDNIYTSRDSRQFGPVPYGLIQGRAFCRVRTSF
ncbi:putative thylakoidal processing peptidase 2, chloroplastic [Apostasia shenzhenica]|uniref:Putative thylakoidal processing peptidase 2, chloroplastic n=1 Tax=Apostasia shenzhenica TaxID=1088818 RepID=A0A2I0B0X0_9ASPA|nr:putative thylakoidal processing peptidase 2, chloroplastic [Apostasia shenzhenica]